MAVFQQLKRYISCLVPLIENLKKFVGGHFILDSREVLWFEWNVFFLGNKDASWNFTKLLVPHKQYCRKHGIRMTIYMNDQDVLAILMIFV